MRPLVLSRASDSAPRTWNGTATALWSLYHFNPSSKSRKRSRRRGVASRRDEESCAGLPDNVKLRGPSMAKVTALSLLRLMASQVSSAALARHPYLCPLDHHSPSRARRDAQELRWQGKAAVLMLKMLVEAAREHGAAATAANRQCTSRGGARKSEPRRGSWCSCGRCGAWSGSWPLWIALCMARTQPTRTAPLPQQLGRPRNRFRTTIKASISGR